VKAYHEIIQRIKRAGVILIQASNESNDDSRLDVTIQQQVSNFLWKLRLKTQEEHKNTSTLPSVSISFHSDMSAVSSHSAQCKTNLPLRKTIGVVFRFYLSEYSYCLSILRARHSFAAVLQAAMQSGVGIVAARIVIANAATTTRGEKLNTFISLCE
jgi:hypothetical protein